jgi:integrase/recombinase XerC
MGRPSKPWYREDRARWVARVDGRQITLARGPKSATEAAARKELRRLLAERDRGVRVGPVAIRTDELCDHFLHHVKTEREPATFDWYRRHLKSFCATHGATPAAEVRPHHVADWSNAHGWGQNTRSGAVTAVKRAFSWGRKMGYIDADPIRDLARPAPARRTAIMSGAQTAEAIAGVSAPLALLLEFLHETGARPGEGTLVAKADVDFARNLIVLTKHKTARATGKRRVIVLSARAAEIVRALAEANPEGPLFRNTEGNPWTRNAMSLAFRRLRRKTGMGREATAQALRHRFATDAAGQYPNTVVAALLGHGSTAMVDRVYSHLGDEHDALRSAVDRIRPGEAPGP